MLYLSCTIQELSLSLILQIFLNDQLAVIGRLKIVQLPPFVYTPCTQGTQRDSERLATCQANLPTTASFHLSMFLIPKPPTFFGLQTSFQLICPGAVLLVSACQIYALQIALTFLITDLGKMKSWYQYVLIPVGLLLHKRET